MSRLLITTQGGLINGNNAAILEPVRCMPMAMVNEILG
jgi:hypothetical protein